MLLHFKEIQLLKAMIIERKYCWWLLSFYAAAIAGLDLRLIMEKAEINLRGKLESGTTLADFSDPAGDRIQVILEWCQSHVYKGLLTLFCNVNDASTLVLLRLTLEHKHLVQ